MLLIEGQSSNTARRTSTAEVSAAVTGFDVVHGVAIGLFGDVAGGHEVGGDLFEGEDADEIDAGGLEGGTAALLAVDEGHGVAHHEAGLGERGGRLKDGAAAGDEVIDDETALAAHKDTLDHVGLICCGRVDVDHGGGDVEREGGGNVQATERHTGDERKRLYVRVAHGHEGFELFANNARAPGERLRVGDKPSEVHIDRRVHGGAAEGEISEIDGVELPQLFGEPQVSGSLR